ncbi:MAG: anti-sigma factor antagonist [Roseburia sp.]|nr:anti-sigma factor antagonist [Roseburia sp.]
MENFSLERNGANLILHISEELDHHTAGQISKTTDVLIEKGTVRNIVFDFSGMTFMDSSGIGMVMGRHRKMHYFGGTVYVTGISPGIDRIFSMSGLYKVIQKIE